MAMLRPSIDPASFEDLSDSDVSTYNPEPRNPGVDPKVYLTNPVQPPPANPETKEAIEARIAELENIEKENAYRFELLASKRQRKDDKSRQRRAMEDHQIQAARAHKDERVRSRRAPQDNAFAQVDRAIDAEEFALRHKLKQLKKLKNHFVPMPLGPMQTQPQALGSPMGREPSNQGLPQMGMSAQGQQPQLFPGLRPQSAKPGFHPTQHAALPGGKGTNRMNDDDVVEISGPVGVQLTRPQPAQISGKQMPVMTQDIIDTTPPTYHPQPYQSPPVSAPAPAAATTSPVKKKINWPPAVRQYVQRCFTPESMIKGISREEMESKLKRVITDAAESGNLNNVNWAELPLPQQMIQEERNRTILAPPPPLNSWLPPAFRINSTDRSSEGSPHDWGPVDWDALSDDEGGRNAADPTMDHNDMFITCTISEDRTGNQEVITRKRLAALGARCVLRMSKPQVEDLITKSENRVIRPKNDQHT